MRPFDERIAGAKLESHGSYVLLDTPYRAELGPADVARLRDWLTQWLEATVPSKDAV